MCMISWNSLGSLISQFKSFSNHEFFIPDKIKSTEPIQHQIFSQKYMMLKNKSLYALQRLDKF